MEDDFSEKFLYIKRDEILGFFNENIIKCLFEQIYVAIGDSE